MLRNILIRLVWGGGAGLVLFGIVLWQDLRVGFFYGSDAYFDVLLKPLLVGIPIVLLEMIVIPRRYRPGIIRISLLFVGCLYFSMFMAGRVAGVHDSPRFAGWLRKVGLPLSAGHATVVLWNLFTASGIALAIALSIRTPRREDPV